MPKTTFTPEQRAKRNAYARERLQKLRESDPAAYRKWLDRQNMHNKPRSEWSEEQIARYKANRIAKRLAQLEADPEAFRAAEREKSRAARLRRIKRFGVHAEKQRQKRAWTVHKYGLTHEEIESLVEACGNRCECCGKHASEVNANRWKGRVLHVDHCHDTGRVRGILCFRCNVMIGHAENSGDLLRKAIAYLETH